MSWFKNAIANLYDLVSAPVDSKGVTLALFMGGVALKLCGEWKTNKGGHVEIVKLCKEWGATDFDEAMDCLLYTSPSPRDKRQSRMPSSA